MKPSDPQHDSCTTRPMLAVRPVFSLDHRRPSGNVQLELLSRSLLEKLEKGTHHSQVPHWEVGFVVSYECRSVSASSSRNESIGSVECGSFPAKARLVLSGSSRCLYGRFQKLKSIYQYLNVFPLVGPRAMMKLSDIHTTRSQRVSLREEIEDETRDLFEPPKVPD